MCKTYLPDWLDRAGATLNELLAGLDRPFPSECCCVIDGQARCGVFSVIFSTMLLRLLMWGRGGAGKVTPTNIRRNTLRLLRPTAHTRD